MLYIPFTECVYNMLCTTVLQWPLISNDLSTQWMHVHTLAVIRASIVLRVIIA